MRTVNVQPDDISLVRLLEDVASGEEIILSSAGRPVAKLVPLVSTIETKGMRKLGGLQGKYVLPDNFDDPLPDDIQRALEGRD